MLVRLVALAKKVVYSYVGLLTSDFDPESPPCEQ